MSSATSVVPLKVFICYSRADEAWREKLADWLKPMEREGVFQVWHDRKLEPGEHWELAIDRHLTSADLVLLLVSKDFLKSDYAYGREMRQALEQDKVGRTRVTLLTNVPTTSPGPNLVTRRARRES